jgi:hypothetical protein
MCCIDASLKRCRPVAPACSNATVQQEGAPTPRETSLHADQRAGKVSCGEAAVRAGRAVAGGARKRSTPPRAAGCLRCVRGGSEGPGVTPAPIALARTGPCFQPRRATPSALRPVVETAPAGNSAWPLAIRKGDAPGQRVCPPARRRARKRLRGLRTPCLMHRLRLFNRSREIAQGNVTLGIRPPQVAQQAAILSLPWLTHDACMVDALLAGSDHPFPSQRVRRPPIERAAANRTEVSGCRNRSASSTST